MNIETKQETNLLNIEDLIDQRIRQQKIYNDCINILLEENYTPDNSNIHFRIMELCITLDKEIEKATLQYRIDKGSFFINTQDKEPQKKPLEYKQLKVSLSESKLLANIYTDKYNEKQIEERQKELQSFPQNANKDIFNASINKLKNLYAMSDKDIMYITHWLTNVKRTILNKEVILPQILCFTSEKQFIGKSFLASLFTKVINKRVITTDLIKLSARFQPLVLTTESVLWIDELKKIDKTVSDNIKSLITADTIDIEQKGKDFKQYRKLASFIMSINYDPSKIFFEDESQRRIAIIRLNKYTEKKTKEQLETLITKIWENTPIKYSIEPDVIAELCFNEPKENTILENFAYDDMLRMFNTDKYFSVTDIQNNLHSYNGGRQKLIAFLKNEDYFIQEYKANKMLIFKATDAFKTLLKDLLQGSEKSIESICEEMVGV